MGASSLKVRTLIISTKIVFIYLGKSANDGLKTKVFMLQLVNLRYGEGFLIATKVSLLRRTRGYVISHLAVRFFFIAVNRFVMMNSSYVATYRLQQSALCSFFDFLPSIWLVFLLNMQNTSEWGIRAFLSDISVNLALKLYKTYGKHAINAIMIHTYQTPQNLAFFLSSST